MSSFTKRITKNFLFEGDTVVVESERMKKEDFSTIAPLMKTEGNKTTIDQSDPDKLLEVGREVLGRRVKGLSGLRTEDGEPLTLQDVVNETYFLELATEILSWIMENSFASEAKK